MRISFAERMKGMKGTSVRNKLFDDPMLISFAAGKPEWACCCGINHKAIHVDGKIFVF